MGKIQSMVNKIAMKKFLCLYELEQGALIVGAVMCVVMLGGIIATIVQIVGLKGCQDYNWRSWMHAFSLSISIIAYYVVMLLVNGWFIWGIRQKKASVVLCWLAVHTVWLAQTVCLLTVLLCHEAGVLAAVAWALCLSLAVICVCILSYCLLVGYGFWLELNSKLNTQTNVEASGQTDEQTK